MIELNGRNIEWEEGLTVEALLRKMNYTYPMIIITVNGEKVDKSEWSNYLIPDGSKVVAHHLIAGG